MLKALIITLLLVLTLGGAPRSTLAGSLFNDVQGGAAMYVQGSPFWTAAPAVSSLGTAFAFGTFFKFAHHSPVHITPGLQIRYDMPMGDVSLMALWAWIRLQFGPIYLGGGAAPLVWNRGTSGTAAGDLNPLSTSTLGFGAELGVLYGFTPEFSLGLAVVGATYMNYATNSFSPLVGANAVLVMRFYYLFWNPSKEEKESYEYKGWRYPMGWMK